MRRSDAHDANTSKHPKPISSNSPLCCPWQVQWVHLYYWKILPFAFLSKGKCQTSFNIPDKTRGEIIYIADLSLHWRTIRHMCTKNAPQSIAKAQCKMSLPQVLLHPEITDTFNRSSLQNTCWKQYYKYEFVILQQDFHICKHTINYLCVVRKEHLVSMHGSSAFNASALTPTERVSLGTWEHLELASSSPRIWPVKRSSSNEHSHGHSCSLFSIWWQFKHKQSTLRMSLNACYA